MTIKRYITITPKRKIMNSVILEDGMCFIQKYGTKQITRKC